MPKVAHDLNLNPSVLDRLLDDDPRGGSLEFDVTDFRNPAGLAVRFRDAADPLSTYIRDQFGEDIQRELLGYDGSNPIPELLLQGLVIGLNLLIKRSSLYDTQRFRHIRLSKETMQLIEQNPPGTISLSLNRTLLEEAYPEDIWKRRRDMPTYTVSQLKNHVSRDLAALLNTRQELPEALSPQFKELSAALLTYGLPDFTALSLVSTEDRKRIRRGVEQAIATFEPRLRSVRVTLEPPQKFDQVLRFRIEALLRVDPAPEPVTFDAVLHMSTHEYSIRG